MGVRKADGPSNEEISSKKLSGPFYKISLLFLEYLKVYY